MRSRRRSARPVAKLRPLAAFRDLRSETGRAAETGGALHIALGHGGLVGENAVISLAGIELLESLADIAVLYDAPPIVTVGDPTLLPIAQDVMRQAYERHNLGERYDPDQVRFIAPSPIAYAAGAAHTIAAENVITNVIIGHLGAEASLLADAAARRDLPQSAAAASADALGVLYPITDRLAVGEELFAAGAQITGERRYLISLKAQDLLRLLLAALILAWGLIELAANLGGR